MSDGTKIEWTDATWPVVAGCTHVSPGCDHCYAARLTSGRLKHRPEYAGLAVAARFTGEVRALPDRLDWPLHWRKPRRIFVSDMADLFHADVPDGFVAAVFVVMAATPQHTFQVLTKRGGRLRSLLADADRFQHLMVAATRKLYFEMGVPIPGDVSWSWPLPNVHVGVSVESQKWADVRIPALLETPAAVRWISAEPLLGTVDLRNLKARNGALIDALGGDVKDPSDGAVYTGAPSVLDWVVTGGESGPRARPMHLEWARSIRDQCTGKGTPFLFKQWGDWCPPRPEHGQSVFGYVTNEDACQVVDRAGRLRGRPWQGWAIQDGTRDAVVMRRYGKKKAGRLLDGRTWDQYPADAR